MTGAMPPPHVQRSAEVVEAWVREQETRRLSADEIAKLTPAQRLDYSRKFDQSTMPAWKDPRG